MRYNKENLEKYTDELLAMFQYVNQEMQENHFDKLPKAKQIELIDINNKLKSDIDELTLYTHWFLDNN